MRLNIRCLKVYIISDIFTNIEKWRYKLCNTPRKTRVPHKIDGFHHLNSFSLDLFYEPNIILVIFPNFSQLVGKLIR